ncbi:MAG: VIT1/CCC1 transporter family protein [Candidatus Aenigmarchaeota archaeon]|nr:VIT1/CCC1 transporter family protein [Candidatus Aenigmarchaeota archaeon]
MSLRQKIREQHSNIGSKLRDFILGWQDGLVNVLGIVLGVAVATTSTKIVLISGLAATFAESISMAAVAYTSMKATNDFYKAERKREMMEIEKMPEMERKEIKDIYYAKGFRGKILDAVVRTITANKKRWVDIMMEEELKLSPEKTPPVQDAIIVGLSAVIGSVIPLFPYVFLGVHEALWYSLAISAAVLFGIGFVKAKLTTGSLLKSGIEMVVVGMVAAIAGYLVGSVLGVTIS